MILASVLAAVAVYGTRAYTQTVSQAVNAQPNPYRTIEHPLTLPAGREMGWIMGVEVDHNGKDIWIFDTCGGGLQDCVTSKVDPILKFDASGKFLKSFGSGMFAHPHGLYIDDKGNVWIVDGFGGNTPPAPMGHQVFKFSPDGKLLLTLGTKGVKGRGPNLFNTPSDVFVAPNGDIFVADGHGSGDQNDRIVKFNKDGKFIKDWGTKGKGPGQFDNTHSLAMDSKGRLFVGDRTNLRIQIFDQDGRFLEEWKQFGAPSEIFIDKKDVIYVADSISNEKVNPGFKRGIRIGNAKDGTLTAFIPDPDPNGSEELVVTDRAGNIWGGLTVGRAIKKYVKN
jgi:sugar lactone lactonase YvrE